MRSGAKDGTITKALRQRHTGAEEKRGGGPLIFAVSDLHGFPLVRFQNGLKSIGFGENDYLYVLGDVIDRHGDGGAAMLRWMITQPNIELLTGNHEQMMLSCAFMLENPQEGGTESLNGKQLRALMHWTDNGGGFTLDGFAELRKSDPGCIPEILDYVRRAPYYDTATVRGRSFLLTHAGLGNFYPEKAIQEYTAEELIWNRPSLDDEYFDDIMTVFGHTPTVLYGKPYKGKIIRTRTWCNIDVNVFPYEDHAAVLRLDDMREFYL